jgi:DNA repair and recombination protein RAD54B
MMDEKIFQRQITKQGLADSFMVRFVPLPLTQDGKGSKGNTFSLEELKNFFSVRETVCDTHDLLACPCNGNGVPVDKELLTMNSQESVEEGFVPASQFKESTKVAASLAISLMEKHKFDALHEFWHFDPWKWKERDDDTEFLCDIIADDMLRSVIQQQLSSDTPNVGISYVFGIRR